MLNASSKLNFHQQHGKPFKVKCLQTVYFTYFSAKVSGFNNCQTAKVLGFINCQTAKVLGFNNCNVSDILLKCKANSQYYQVEVCCVMSQDFVHNENFYSFVNIGFFLFYRCRCLQPIHMVEVRVSLFNSYLVISKLTQKTREHLI